MRLWYW